MGENVLVFFCLFFALIEQQNVATPRFKSAGLFCMRFMSPIASVAALAARTKHKQQRFETKSSCCVYLFHLFISFKKSAGLAGFSIDAAIMAVKELLWNKENGLFCNKEKNMNRKMFLKYFSV